MKNLFPLAYAPPSKKLYNHAISWQISFKCCRCSSYGVMTIWVKFQENWRGCLDHVLRIDTEWPFRDGKSRLRWNLVLFCQFAVVRFDLISNIVLCLYARRTLRMKILIWCRVISRAGSGSGLSLSKYVGPISGLRTKLFYSIKSNVCFLSWRRFVVLTAVQ